MTRYRTQSRFKPLRDFIRQPALHAAIALIAALAIIEYFSKAP